jgi:TolA-binding protein
MAQVCCFRSERFAVMMPLVFALAALLAVSACGGPGSNTGSDAVTGAGSADEVAAWIAELELTADTDSSSARAVLRAYADFGNRHRSDSRAAEFLFRRALRLNTAGQSIEAVAQWSDIHDGFPKFSKRADCAFWVGFVSENDLGDRERARKAYLLVMESHPDSRFAGHAADALKLMQNGFDTFEP